MILTDEVLADFLLLYLLQVQTDQLIYALYIQHSLQYSSLQYSNIIWHDEIHACNRQLIHRFIVLTGGWSTIEVWGFVTNPFNIALCYIVFYNLCISLGNMHNAEDITC